MKIEELLNDLQHKVYGKEVRQGFVDSIRQCYKDATGNPDSVAAIVKENAELSQKIASEEADRKSEIDIERKRINNIVTGTVSTTKFMTVNSEDVRIEIGPSDKNVSFDINTNSNKELLNILSKNPRIIEARLVEVNPDARLGVENMTYYQRSTINNDYIGVSLYATMRGPTCTVTYRMEAIFAYDDEVVDTSSAELADIRVGANGEKYDNAGEAVRQQISSLKEDLNINLKNEYDLYEYSENRLCLDNLTENAYISRNGNIAKYDGYSLSDLLPVEGSSTYVFYNYKERSLYNNIYYGLFDVNKKWIGCGNTEAEDYNQRKMIQTDDNTAYVRISQASDCFNAGSMLTKKEYYEKGNRFYVSFKKELKGSKVNEEITKVNEKITKVNEKITDIGDDINLDIKNKCIVFVNNNMEIDIRTDDVYSMYKTAVIDCTTSDVFYYTGRVYNYDKQYSIIFANDNGLVCAYYLDNQNVTDYDNYEIVAPENATKLYVVSYGKEPSLKKGKIIDIKGKIIDIKGKIDSLKLYSKPNYDNVMRSIQRIGEGMSPYPHHSIDAFKEAYKRGFRIFLCDLIFTKDDIGVCNHDSYLNENYKDTYDDDGNLVSTDNPVYISENKYADLNKYNYGAAGYKLLKFVDMLKLVKNLGVELYVEIKGMNENQAKIACNLIKMFKLEEKTSWAGTVNQMKMIINNIETARVATMPMNINDATISSLNTLKTGKNKVFIFGWDTTILTDEILTKLIENDIEFEFGTPSSEDAIVKYFENKNAYYCTGIETNSLIAGKVLLEHTITI